MHSFFERRASRGSLAAQRGGEQRLELGPPDRARVELRRPLAAGLLGQGRQALAAHTVRRERARDSGRGEALLEEGEQGEVWPESYQRLIMANLLFRQPSLSPLYHIRIESID